MIASIVRVLLQELLLLLNSFIKIVEDEGQRVLVHHLCFAVCCEHLLHDLVQEIVTEVAHCDSSRFLNEVLRDV